MNCEDIRAQIVFYVDNELSGEDRLCFEAHISTCPSCRDKLTSERRFLDRIRDADPLYPASPALRARMAALFRSPPPQPEQSAYDSEPAAESTPDVSRRRLTHHVVAWAATLTLTLTGLLALGSLDLSRFLTPAPDFAQASVEAHRRYLMGALPLEVASDQPETVSGWFHGKLSFSLALPSYPDDSPGAKPYRVKGARLLGFNNNDAAYVAYEMGTTAISLVIASSQVATPSGGERIASGKLVFHYQMIGGYKVITWSDRGLTYALVSTLGGRGQESCRICHGGTKDNELFGS